MATPGEAVVVRLPERFDMQEAGCETRPELLVWCGAVRTAVFAGHARPSAPKVSVLFRRSDAFSSLSSVGDRRE